MKSGKKFWRHVAVVTICSAVSVSLSLLASSAFAQAQPPVFLIGPGGAPPTPPGGTTGGLAGTAGTVTGIKTPPMSAGQSVSIPIDVHNSSGFVLPNWAGVLVEVHLADPSEVDITAVKVGGVPVPHPFPLSGHTFGGAPAPGSTVATFPVFHPAAFLSGVSLQPSSVFPAITLDLVAKNTDPINNSDVDINLRFADIYHRPGTTYIYKRVNTATTTVHLSANPGSTWVPMPTPGSTSWHWEASHRILVPSSIGGLPDLHLTAGGHQANSNYPFPNHPPSSQTEFDSKYVIPRGVEPESGHFLHIPFGANVHRVASSVPFHNLGRTGSSTIVLRGSTWVTTFTAFVPGSQIIAMPFLATASIGIEHIPEPTAPILLLGGLASLTFGFRARRRRQQLT